MGKNVYFCCWPFKLFKGFFKNAESSDVRRWGIFYFSPDRCERKRKRSFPPLGSCCNDERVRCSMCACTQAGWVFFPSFFVATQCYFALIFHIKMVGSLLGHIRSLQCKSSWNCGMRCVSNTVITSPFRLRVIVHSICETTPLLLARV